MAHSGTLDVKPLSQHIGAEVRGLDLSADLGTATINALNELWLEHLVLLFRDQKLSQEDQNTIASLKREIEKGARATSCPLCSLCSCRSCRHGYGDELICAAFVTDQCKVNQVCEVISA